MRVHIYATLFIVLTANPASPVLPLDRFMGRIGRSRTGSSTMAGWLRRDDNNGCNDRPLDPKQANIMSPSSEDSDPKPTTHRKGDLKVLSGRGAVASPPVRFERIAFSESESQLEEHDEFPTKVKTDYYDDASQSIVSENQSPDLGFRFSINPYRGCLHGCSYCYARPTHEYLGLNCGLDFETKILVKTECGPVVSKMVSPKKILGLRADHVFRRH